jgi:Amt family ammonium transporter
VGAAGPKIPELLYAFYQGMFACFTPALICGGVIKKFRAGRFLAFILLWSLLVYYPVARWTWSPEGFSSQHGVMDFSGGTAVHITSGTAVGAVVLFDAVERHGWGVFAHAWAIIYPKPTPAPPLNVMTIRREDSGLSDEASPTAPASNMNTTASPRSSTGDPKLTPEIPSHPPSPRVPTPAPPSARMLTSQTVFPHMLPAPQLDPSAILGDDAPHSLNNMILGTLQLWFGWFGM